jgi:hypothetical protein
MTAGYLVAVTSTGLARYKSGNIVGIAALSPAFAYEEAFVRVPV